MDKENVENTNQMDKENIPEDLVFGLDIGTRNIVGTVGYRESNGHFVVIAQTVVQHATRAMLDGQIHDIGRVADNIEKVRDRLEEMIGRSLRNVCIAAAGRVLQTIEEDADVKFATETVVTSEHVYSLDMLAVEKAHEKLKELDHSGLKFFCVGYSVMHYYQNDYPISNLEGHKCTSIRTELIATFLPEEVVDGLYAAVERAGLYVENLTLEPIAAINIAIPERFRLLNIALVDVGAGTSDISITKDGSIIAYGMIPYAGDEMTESIAKHYLVDFQEADRLKCESTNNEEVTFHDIMGLPQQVNSTEVEEVVSETVHMITKSIADKIIELNGGKSVSAVFIVGGGGKMRGFTSALAEYLDLQKERVALRGTEVLGEVTFLQQDVEIDSLLVTPVGICLNYYEQRNNFVFVNINGERIKLYDNGKLTILDAALQVGLPNEVLFPQRGDALTYTINGEKRMQRGEHGESAVIRLNEAEAGISTPISQNDTIEVTPSTKGVEGVLRVENLPEYKSTISYYVNDKKVVCPCFVSVNEELVSGNYEIQEGDSIQVLDYYTLEQVLEFMDVAVDGVVFVNNEPAQSDTKVYDNFTVKCDIPELEVKPHYWKDAVVPENLLQEAGVTEQLEKDAAKQETESASEDAAKPEGEKPENDAQKPEAGALTNTDTKSEPEEEKAQGSTGIDKPQEEKPQNGIETDKSEEEKAQNGIGTDKPEEERAQNGIGMDKPQEEKPQGSIGLDKPEEKPQGVIGVDKPEEEKPQIGLNKPEAEKSSGDWAKPETEKPQNAFGKPFENTDKPEQQKAAEHPADNERGNIVQFGGTPQRNETVSSGQGTSPFQMGKPAGQGASSWTQSPSTQQKTTGQPYSSMNGAVTGQSPSPQQRTPMGQTQQAGQGTTPNNNRLDVDKMIQQGVSPLEGSRMGGQSGLAGKNPQAQSGMAQGSQGMSLNTGWDDNSGKVPPLMPRVQRTSQPVTNAANMIVTVNGESIVLKGKASYVLVDILDVYPIDTAVAHGDRMEIKVNGADCDFSHPIRSGDNVVLRWVED